jgi:hypothetical protein
VSNIQETTENIKKKYQSLQKMSNNIPSVAYPLGQPQIHHHNMPEDDYMQSNEYDDNLIDDDDSYEEVSGLPNFGGDDLPSKPVVNTTMGIFLFLF